MKAIIFDLDGTLLDRNSTLEAFCLAQHAKFNLSVNRDVYCKRLVELDANGYVRKEKVYDQIVKENNWSTDLKDSLFEDYMNHFHEYCVAFRGLHETLEELRRQKYLIGMITNGRYDGQQASLKALGIDSFFHVVLISESEGISKPNPLIFLRALSELQVEPQEAVYVGDHPINDIEAAKKVGLLTIWKSNDVYDHANADEKINGLNEILEVLKRREEIELHSKHEEIDWK
ncbi:MAG: HAD family hydrolase [Paenisporosarcina sp.]|nr:HAD family hydrolase [Paenisporosarcina sp.]